MKKTLVVIIVFAVAMGMMEAAIVVYLRELFYKSGFAFPLKPISSYIARIEFFREAATIIMLVAAGILAGKNRLQRFAYFVLAFAIWDLFYYLFLFIFQGWPQSLFTWDILFLIPFPWVGPVWAPCLLCALMITGSMRIIKLTDINYGFKVSTKHWLLLIGGALICILSFMWDYLQQVAFQTTWTVFSKEALFRELGTYVPISFNYPLFFCGFFLMSTAVVFNWKPKTTTDKY